MTPNLKYTCLFGGGAIRGLAYVGAVRAMEELGVEFDIIGGSSVGSIFATLIACGYKSYELENLFMKVNFDLFKDIHLGFGKPFALSKGEIFIDWLNEIISKKFDSENKKNITFKDLNKKLVIIATNLKKFSTQEFSSATTPDFEIAKAIRISSSMPGLMPPYRYKNSVLVDGDLQKASPMWKLSKTIDNSESRIMELRLEGDCSEDSTSPIAFINTIYSCVTDVATKFVTEVYGCNDRYDCIKIGTGDLFFADFSLDKESRRKVIESGYQQTMKYFKEVLPAKKEKLKVFYSQLLKYLKNANKGLRTNNVEEVQWWLGDIFTLLCENKEIIDPVIYSKIVDLKNKLMDSSSRFMIFYTKFDNRKELEDNMKTVINSVDSRLAEIKMYLH